MSRRDQGFCRWCLRQENSRRARPPATQVPERLHWTYINGETRGGNAMAGKLIEAICPKCGAPMLRRRRRADGAEFWGCSRYPACRRTRELVAAETPQLEPIVRASVGGTSARAEFDRRAARDREVIRRARPFILAFAGAGAILGLVMAAVGPMPAGPLGPTFRLFWLFVPIAAVGATVTALLLPATTVAWRTGATGEERTGELLRPLETQGFRVIHDRLIPGRREN